MKNIISFLATFVLSIQINDFQQKKVDHIVYSYSDLRHSKYKSLNRKRRTRTTTLQILSHQRGPITLFLNVNNAPTQHDANTFNQYHNTPHVLYHCCGLL